MDISIFLFGGLGNRLFQMASCFGIARKRGGRHRIAGYDPGGSRNSTAYVGLMKRFDPDTTLNVVRFKELYAQATDKDVFREQREYQFDPAVCRPDAPRTLVGYFQAESYFHEYRRELLTLFQESARITEALEKMTLPFAESYFVHFRFQDFLRRHRKKHFIDLTGYYRQCLKQLPVDASLLIFSDEPEKIEQHYPEIGKAGTFVECNSDLVSLYAMARCRLGGICANSTFSWWGAYLNPSREKRVYMPDRFTNSRRCGPDFYPRNTLVCPVARPKAYVINLDRRQDRWAQIQRQLKGLESTIDVCRFSAVEVAAHPHMGCTRSHKNIVSMAKENMWPMVMVMEDDAVLRNPRATRDLVDFLYTRQDWDVCFGGVSACRPELWAALTARTPSCPTVYKNISEQIMEIPVSLSSVMVIYNQTSYDTVLAIDQYDPNVRIDVFLSENIHRKWVHVPFLAHQQPGYSDIQHCELDSTSLYERCEQFLVGLKQIPKLGR